MPFFSSALKFFLRVVRFVLLLLLKTLSRLFYPCKARWSPEKIQDWQNVKLIIFLNHTSLFEVLFIQLASIKGLWAIADRFIAPGADITFERPIVGKILHTLIPGIIPISRKKDDTWQHFLSLVDHEKITAILPEGRMKRRNGLDKNGQPMSVRSGFVDILQKLNHGQILFVYSGGLHHIQAPGEKLPKLFKKIKANLEVVDLLKYKQQFNMTDATIFKTQVMTDVGNKLRDNIPS